MTGEQKKEQTKYGFGKKDRVEGGVLKNNSFKRKKSQKKVLQVKTEEGEKRKEETRKQGGGRHVIHKLRSSGGRCVLDVERTQKKNVCGKTDVRCSTKNQRKTKTDQCKQRHEVEAEEKTKKKNNRSLQKKGGVGKAAVKIAKRPREPKRRVK